MNDNNPTAVELPDLPEGWLQPGDNGSPINEHLPSRDSEGFDYISVPPRRTVVVSVRYHIRGRGQPLSYPLDDEGTSE